MLSSSEMTPEGLYIRPLHWTKDEWRHVQDSRSTDTALGVSFVDIEVSTADRTPVRFTFRWDAGAKWEGVDYAVELRES
jgi:hypothetical protein